MAGVVLDFRKSFLIIINVEICCAATDICYNYILLIINIFTQQWCIKLIKSNSKDI